MATQTSGKKETKRISFLMPYIDFCFMLIIIFVSMLSIAYFEPLGTTDIQAERESKIDIREGENPVLPPGIQLQRKGIGEQSGAGAVNPLIAPDANRAGAAAAPGTSTARPAADVEKLKNELAENKKKLKELEEELEKKKDKVGKGDHLYIDLGGE
ncbi:MAG: hypothetical protein ABIH66_09900 [bacterium]